MRKVWIIALNGLNRTARDRKALALLLLMPMILIGILGAALNSMFTGPSMQRFDVVVVNEDRGAAALNLGNLLVQQVLAAPDVQEVVNVVPAKSTAAAREQVATGRAVAAIRVPPDYSAALFSDQRADLEIWTDPGRPQQAEIVVSIARQFTDDTVSTFLALQFGHLPNGSVPAASIARQGHDHALSAGGDGGTETARQQLAQTRSRVVKVPSGTRPVAALQYYAAAMSIMFMIMTAMGRAKDLIQERQDGTLTRILLTPTPRAAILAGQALGSMVLLLAQFGLLYMGTHLLYGIYWGPVPGVLALGSAFSLAVAGMATAVAAFLNEPRAADAAVGLVGNLFAVLSGCMIPLYVFPPAMKAIAHAIPNYWALSGFVDLMSGLGMASILLPVTVLVALGLGAGALGSWRLAWRQG